MKNIIKLFKWLWWRVTGYREMTRLLHHLYCKYDALTDVGLERLHYLASKEEKYYYRNAPFS